MNREKDNLQALGKKTDYRQDYAPEVLESFVNKHPDNDYWVQFNCPEFTSLCPITGQPDFAEIKIQYIPDVKMVESKSLKLYLFSFRNHGDFQLSLPGAVEHFSLLSGDSEQRAPCSAGGFFYDSRRLRAFHAHRKKSSGRGRRERNVPD